MLFRRFLGIVLVLPLLAASTSLAQENIGDPQLAVAAEDPNFLRQGEYASESRAAQVVAFGDGDFEVVIYQGGLPGAGWDGQPPQRADMDSEQVTEFLAEAGMTRSVRKSSSLGQAAPSGAIVLFDGSEQSLSHWNPGARRTPAGFLAHGATTSRTFSDYHLHLEFRTPFMPTAEGQARGNSGVYHQGRYETQILDSFGLEGQMDETGGIYTIRAPNLNMCLPPLTWQTYDVEFTAAVYDAAGKKISPASITVWLNGVVVQQDVTLAHATRAAPNQEGPESGPIHLQDHGNPVCFQNIWIEPRDRSLLDQRPKVPAFERFYSNIEAGSPKSAQGGVLLLNELGCANCHQSESPWVAANPAPDLSQAGDRLRGDFLAEFIANPAATRQGSRMPGLLANHLATGNTAETKRAVHALASFLDSTGATRDRRGRPQVVNRGRVIYQSVGCVICHSESPDSGRVGPDQISLSHLWKKYTLSSLARYLANPHAHRPGSRMPKLLERSESREVATYLLKDFVVGPTAANYQAEFYEGEWDNLPDFDALQPVETLDVYGLDITARGPQKAVDLFGVKFQSYFVPPQDGEYEFTLASDDGSRLTIDDTVVVLHDGLHGPTLKTGTIRLDSRPHKIRIDYFEKYAGEEIHLTFSGGGLKDASLNRFVMLDPDAATQKPDIASKFVADRTLLAEGQALFSSQGCASCHVMDVGGLPLKSSLKAPNLSLLTVAAKDAPFVGCLAQSVAAGLPAYSLTADQRQAIHDALRFIGAAPAPAPKQKIRQVMESRNCYACHQRGTIGGPTAANNPHFHTAMQAMGDEGRLPPPLTGVGDKLNLKYLKETLRQGADERSYMAARMPGFGDMDRLADLFAAEDRISEASIPDATERLSLQQANGRILAGDRGLACIKCHTAGGEGTGIRVLDMQDMTTRLRKDWFHRYLMNPTKYRPGTRMPASFVDGKSAMHDMYGGQPPHQIEALWAYFEMGEDASLPAGALPQAIALSDPERPILYRNFLQGVSARGIAVGYPQEVHQAWDADQMGLAMVWKGEFIDAGKHWIGRGQGTQRPLGAMVMKLDASACVAQLPAVDAAWPTTTSNPEYQFRGYQLSSGGLPTFRYRLGECQVSERLTPIQDAEYGAAFRRTIRVADASAKHFLRLAVGKQIRRTEAGYEIDGRLQIRCPNAAIVVVDSEGGSELRIAIPQSESFELSYDLLW